MKEPCRPEPCTHAPVFKPTFKQFHDVRAFLESPEVQKAGFESGIVKIVCPKEWAPTTKDAVHVKEVSEAVPVITQTFKKENEGLYFFVRSSGKWMTVPNWSKRAKRRSAAMDRNWENVKKLKLSDQNLPGECDCSFDETSRKYWQTRERHKALYCVDIENTMMDPQVKEWNLGSPDFQQNCLTRLVRPVHKGESIPGVTAPYLYFGAQGTTFGFHTEDADLFSINYLHEAKVGGEKRWYGIPPAYGDAFEKFVKEEFSDTKECDAFMREKSIVIRPDKIRAAKIPVFEAQQGKHEIVVTFPYAYHGGFNAGPNLAEARNIALKSWIPYGLSSAKCSCGECPADPFPRDLIEKIAETEDPEEFARYKARDEGAKYPHPGQKTASAVD